MIDGAARGHHIDLPRDFVFEGALHVAERVEVLELRLDAECLLAGRPHRYVRVTAQAALFHVAVVDADCHEDGAQPRKELRGVRRRSEVRLRDDFDEGHAAAIEIEVGAPVGVGKAFVQRLPGVLFHVHPDDADTLGRALRLEFDLASRGQRPVVLRDLIALRQVGIEVVLPGENGDRLDGGAERVRGAHRVLHGAPVQDRQGAGQTQAHRAHVDVRRCAERGAAATKDFAGCQQLTMDLEADDRLKGRQLGGSYRGVRENGKDGRSSRSGSGRGRLTRGQCAGATSCFTTPTTPASNCVPLQRSSSCTAAAGLIASRKTRARIMVS